MCLKIKTSEHFLGKNSCLFALQQGGQDPQFFVAKFLKKWKNYLADLRGKLLKHFPGPPPFKIVGSAPVQCSTILNLVL